jgi:protein-L-isoaspartate(D-aspartate) O-methyltransferase
MIDPKQQRINMVESQVRPSDITDRRIIRAMLEVPRETFVPAALQALAYIDEAVPVTQRLDGQAPRTLLAPRTFAKLVQLAEIEPDDVVLDVGCATGYSTAVLARLARSVVALEVDEALAARAAEALRQLRVANVVVVPGPLEAGAPAQAPFDAILLQGAVPQAPQALLEQLKDGGRLVAVIADGAYGRGELWRRRGSAIDGRGAFDASAEPLPGFTSRVEFSL